MNQMLGVLVAILFSCTSVLGADKIRVSMTGFAGQFMTFPLAQKRGFLKEEGIEAEIIRISAAAGRAALSGGEVDYSTGIGGTAIGGALSGVPIKVVACFVPAPVLALVARPEIKSVQALKGKTIAVLIFGGVARFAALSQGLVDAAVLGPPLDFEARKQGFNILARAHDVLVFPETGLVTSVKKIQDKPDEIKRVIRAGIKANRYIRTNHDGTIQFLMEWLKLNREVATATYDGVVKVYDDDINVCEKGLCLVIDETKKTMKVTRDVPLSEIADLSIIREAQKELGIK